MNSVINGFIIVDGLLYKVKTGWKTKTITKFFFFKYSKQEFVFEHKYIRPVSTRKKIMQEC